MENLAWNHPILYYFIGLRDSDTDLKFCGATLILGVMPIELEFMPIA